MKHEIVENQEKGHNAEETETVVIRISGLDCVQNGRGKKLERLLCEMKKHLENSGIPNEILIDAGREYLVSKKHHTTEHSC